MVSDSDLHPPATRASPLQNLQVLLLLLLVGLAPLTVGKSNKLDQHCRCKNNEISGISVHSISLVNVFRSRAHCDKVEVIATLKNGEKKCLDPSAFTIRRTIMAILQGYLTSRLGLWQTTLLCRSGRGFEIRTL
uniref:platelet basic protein-like n=1 Tax=Arvicanthis niloticus TaxID=61156 RepID=UPI00402B3395